MLLNRVTSRAVFSRYLTEAEERQLFRYVGQFGSVLARRDLAWMKLLRQTGLRVSSLAGLTAGEARAALSRRRLVVADEHAKGERGYEVPLNSAARAALSELLAVRRAMHAEMAADAPLILSLRARAMSVRSFQSRMRQWVEESGLPVAASPHWLRHTLAKRVMARSTASDPRGLVQAALGHASIDSTVVYTLPDREAVAEALEAAR